MVAQCVYKLLDLVTLLLALLRRFLRELTVEMKFRFRLVGVPCLAISLRQAVMGFLELRVSFESLFKVGNLLGIGTLIGVQNTQLEVSCRMLWIDLDCVSQERLYLGRIRLFRCGLSQLPEPYRVIVIGIGASRLEHEEAMQSFDQCE